MSLDAVPRGRSLATRLLLAQGLVLTASILTAGLVASLLGPTLFHQHLLEAGHSADSPELEHIELAYREANLASLGLALLTALLCALVVAWYLTRRIQRPLVALTHAAEEMSSGRYQTRVAASGAGPELDTLASAFNTMAERLERIEDTRRRLLSDLAHEMRTPIATLGAYLEALEDGVRELDRATWQVLDDQTSRLRKLAEDIDDVSRAEEGRLQLDLEPHRVDDLLDSAAQVARGRYAAKGVALVSGPRCGLTLTADGERLGQVLANLLDNALRHTPPGGTVTLHGEAVGDRARLVVADDGEGIPAEQLPHVFERFYRGDTSRDRARSGSGIGLTISRAIADAHGGTLEAASDGPGAGATFSLTLPRA